MKYLAIIPARYASTRFPGKPLAIIGGKTMIQRVYEQVGKAVSRVFVATDDQRIEQAIKNFGGNVIMTSSGHNSGTDRVNEANEKIQQLTGELFDVVINIQGDEPFIQPEQIAELMNCFNDPDTEIATLIKPITNNQDLFNSNIPKVIINQQKQAIYFSRATIPYIRNKDTSEWLSHYPFNKHIGIYAYKSDILKKITNLPASSLELAESLEQNRWIENGFSIKTATTQHDNYPVDTQEDLKKLAEKLKEK